MTSLLDTVMRSQHTPCKHKYTIHTTHTTETRKNPVPCAWVCALLPCSEDLWPPGSRSQWSPAGGNCPRCVLFSSLTALGASCSHIWASRSEAVSAGKTGLLLLDPGLWPQPHPHPTRQEGGREAVAGGSRGPSFLWYVSTKAWRSLRTVLTWHRELRGRKRLLDGPCVA